MTPIVFAQCPTSCKYATEMPGVAVEDVLEDAWIAELIQKLSALPPERQRIRYAEPLRGNHAVDNVARLASALLAANILPAGVVFDSEDGRSLKDIITAWKTILPALPLSNYGQTSQDLLDTGPVGNPIVPEANNWPAVGDATMFDEQSPSCYGWADGLLKQNEKYRESFNIVGLMLAQIQSVYRFYDRRNLPKPKIIPWIAPYTNGIMTLQYWYALQRGIALRCGPMSYWFNGDYNGSVPDQQLTNILQDIESITSDGEYAGSLGMGIKYPLPKLNDNWVTSFARFGKTIVGHCIFKNYDTTYSVNVPETNKVIKFVRLPGECDAWAKI